MVTSSAAKYPAQPRLYAIARLAVFTFATRPRDCVRSMNRSREGPGSRWRALSLDDSVKRAAEAALDRGVLAALEMIEYACGHPCNPALVGPFREGHKYQRWGNALAKFAVSLDFARG